MQELAPRRGTPLLTRIPKRLLSKPARAKPSVLKTPLSRPLVVYKYDSVTGEAIEGAVFQVKYPGGTSGTGGTVIGTYKTSANGSFTVTGLKKRHLYRRGTVQRFGPRH